MGVGNRGGLNNNINISPLLSVVQRKFLKSIRNDNRLAMRILFNLARRVLIHPTRLLILTNRTLLLFVSKRNRLRRILTVVHFRQFFVINNGLLYTPTIRHFPIREKSKVSRLIYFINHRSDPRYGFKVIYKRVRSALLMR